MIRFSRAPYHDAVVVVVVWSLLKLSCVRQLICGDCGWFLQLKIRNWFWHSFNRSNLLTPLVIYTYNIGKVH